MLKCTICKNKNTKKCKCELQFERCGTVFDHTLEVLKCLPKNASFELQIAALLHDIGKNEKTFDNIDGKRRFIHHEFLGTTLAKKRLKQLKFTNNEINKIVFLIEHHMDIYKLTDVSDKSIRKFIRNTGEYIDDLFILVDSDGAGTHFFDKKKCIIRSISAKTEIQNRVYTLKAELEKASEKPFKYFNGNDLMKEFNIDKPCKKVGILIKIQDDIIDEFGINLNKDDVLKIIKKRYNELI